MKYSKRTNYKACPPKETVARIKKILEDLNIPVFERMLPHEEYGCYSCIVGVADPDILEARLNTNGKGSTRERNPDAGLILHNDRGCNYQSQAIRKYLKNVGIVHSFSRPGTPHDNAVMESFFSTLKREELYRRFYRSEKELYEALKNYIDFYNKKRPVKMFCTGLLINVS